MSFSGLIVCSMFLSLQLFEIFYCLCVMMNAVLYISAKKRKAIESMASNQKVSPVLAARKKVAHRY